MSVNLLSLKVCLASNGWLWSDARARLASSTLRDSMKRKLYCCHRWEYVPRKTFCATHPLLLPVESSHGIWMSSGLIVTPFLENSLQTFASSFSSLSWPMVGTPSTTSTLSKLSSYLTLYLMKGEYHDLQVICGQVLVLDIWIINVVWILEKGCRHGGSWQNFFNHQPDDWLGRNLCMYLLS